MELNETTQTSEELVSGLLELVSQIQMVLGLWQNLKLKPVFATRTNCCGQGDTDRNRKQRGWSKILSL